MTRLSNTAVPSMAAVSLLGKSSSVQLDLYHNWYPFDFEEAAYGMSRIDFIAGGAAADSGTIGLVNLCLDPLKTSRHERPPPPILRNLTHDNVLYHAQRREGADSTRPSFTEQYTRL
jgi:hypothetical protein